MSWDFSAVFMVAEARIPMPTFLAGSSCCFCFFWAGMSLNGRWSGFCFLSVVALGSELRSFFFFCRGEDEFGKRGCWVTVDGDQNGIEGSDGFIAII